MIIDRTQEICRSRINKDAGHIIRWLRKVFSLRFQYYYSCLWLCNLLLHIALVSTQESLLCSVFFYFLQLCWSTLKLVIPFYWVLFLLTCSREKLCWTQRCLQKMLMVKNTGSEHQIKQFVLPLRNLLSAWNAVLVTLPEGCDLFRDAMEYGCYLKFQRQ